MKGNLKQALENVEMTYDQLAQIANSIAGKETADVKKIIVEQAGNVKQLTDEQIRNLIVLISIKSYSLAEAREHAALKLECAETIRKEEHAKIFTSTEGTVGAKDTAANLGTTDEIMTEAVYQLVSSLIKSAVDECHRVVDALKSVLMSRMQQAKIEAMSQSNRAAFE